MLKRGPGHGTLEPWCEWVGGSMSPGLVLIYIYIHIFKPCQGRGSSITVCHKSVVVGRTPTLPETLSPLAPKKPSTLKP